MIIIALNTITICSKLFDTFPLTRFKCQRSEFASSLLVMAVAPRTEKIIKNGLNVLERGEVATKWCITLCVRVKPIVRNRVGLEFFRFF